MSFEAMLAVQRLSYRTTHACFRVLMTLAEHADRFGRNSYPSIDTIATEAQTDEKTVRRCLTKLELQGLIAGERGRGRGKTTVWALNFLFQPLAGESRAGGQPTESKASKEGVAPGITPEKPGMTPSISTQKEGMLPGFDSVKEGLVPVKEGLVPVKEGLTPPEPVHNQSITKKRSRTAGNGAESERRIWDEAIVIWNSVVGDVLPRAKPDIPPDRMAALRARLANEMGGSLANWRAYCQRVRAAPFLIGGGDRGWKADIDWCLRPTNMAKVTQGNFDDRTGEVPRRTGASYAGCL